MSPLILHQSEPDGRASSTKDVTREWTEEVLVRWELARKKLMQVDPTLIPQQHALRILVEQDFPQVVKELKRSRPELA